MKDYKYYGWLDFGLQQRKNVNDIDRIPKNINFNYLHKNKILYQSLVKKLIIKVHYLCWELMKYIFKEHFGLFQVIM